MADRYDPKLAGRPLADRKAGQPAGEDPLFELAKLVQGRSGAPAAPAPAAAKVRTVPPADDTLPTASEQADALADLEAELLSDLQASFAAVKGAISAPPLAPVVVPPPQQAAPPPPPPPKPAEPVMRALPPAPPPPTAAAPAPTPTPPAQQAQPSRFAAARPPLQAVPPPAHLPHLPPAMPMPMPEPAQPRAPAPPPPVRPAASNEARVDIANLQLRPTVPPPAKPPAVAAPPVAEAPLPTAKDKGSRWERPVEPVRAQPGLASRFAPPRAGGPTAQPVPPVTPPPATENLDDLPFGDGPPFGAPHEQQDEEYTLDGLDLGPALGEDEQIPPYPDEELEGLGRRRVPRGAVILGGVLAVAIVGGAAAMLLRPGGSGTTTPPVILADTSPTKVAPPASQAPANDPQNKLIYDRVDSRGAQPQADTKLVTPGSEKIASVPPAANDGAISRVILPGAPTGDGKPAAAAAAAPPASDTELGADGKPIGPRKVRTVVVKPDGTIVSSEAAPADAARPQQGAAATVPPVLPPAQNDDTAAIAGQPGGKELAITPVPGTPTSLPPEKAQPAPVPRVQAAPQPVVRNDPPPAAKVVQPPQQKVVDSSAPIDLTPARPAARPPAQQQAALPPAQQVQPAPVATGGMLVQVSSQRSEDAARATYRDLQARYPNVLGSYQPNIQRADLGDRGVYYRVRVGPLAGSDAQRLCDALKSAGGDCVLTGR